MGDLSKKSQVHESYFEHISCWYSCIEDKDHIVYWTACISWLFGVYLSPCLNTGLIEYELAIFIHSIHLHISITWQLQTLQITKNKILGAALKVYFILTDNAYDPDVCAKQFWIDKTIVEGQECLSFMDNGNGLDRETMHKMLRYWCCKFTFLENLFGQQLLELEYLSVYIFGCLLLYSINYIEFFVVFNDLFGSHFFNASTGINNNYFSLKPLNTGCK